MNAITMMDAALHYARAGMAVFPLHSNENGACSCGGTDCTSPAKHPRTPHGLADASKDEERIRRWWTRWPGANVGVATGAVSGVVVLDVDPQHGGDDSMVGLREEHGDLPATRSVRTGGGGTHFYFAHPGVEIRNSAGRLGDGLDVRGDGGYVVAAPSVHISGRAYEWTAERDLAPLPAWLLAEMQAPRSRPTTPTPTRSAVGAGGGTPYGIAALRKETAEIASAPEGTRNDRLNAGAFSLGQLVAGGELERGVAEHALVDAGLAAGLSETEARRTTRSGLDAGIKEPRSAPTPGASSPTIATTPSGVTAAGDVAAPPTPSPRILCTDLGNARRLVARHGRDLRHCSSFGWFVWDGRRWKKDDTGAAMRAAKETAESIWDEVKRAESDTERDRLIAWARQSQNQPKLAALLTVASTEEAITVTTADFDRDPWLLNVKNGTLNLKTGALHPHRREDLLTKITLVDYDATAKCPAFERFLEQVFEGKRELIAFVQKACGYSLTGDVGHQVLFFLHGEGANGKSTLIEILLFVLGEYAEPAAPDLLLARRGERHPTELADLFGKRMVSCVEVGQGRGFNEAVVKWITGGDRLKARLMRMDFFHFAPTHKVFLCANSKPRVAETNHAFWRRMRMIPFNTIFKDKAKRAPGESEDLRPGEKDVKLPETLRAEAAGILRWAVEGCLRLQQDGLDPPAEVRQATEEYRQGEDVLGLFLDERCVRAKDATAGKGKLYDAYVAWAKQAGEDVLRKRDFRKELLARGLTEGRAGHGGPRCWFGVALNDPSDDLFGDAVTDGDARFGMNGDSPPREAFNPNSASPSVTRHHANGTHREDTTYDDGLGSAL